MILTLLISYFQIHLTTPRSYREREREKEKEIKRGKEKQKEEKILKIEERARELVG